MLRLLRAAAAAFALLAPAGAQNIGVREARPGSLRGPPSHADFARLLGVVPGGPDCGGPDNPCCTPEGTDDPFCNCGPICPAVNEVVDLDKKCLCGTCVNNTACTDAGDDCENNCLYDQSTVPIYLSLRPSDMWLKLYESSDGGPNDPEGPAKVLFKRGRKQTCAQSEYLQATELDDGLVLEVVKRLEPLPPPQPERARARRMKGKPAPAPVEPSEEGCAVGKVAQDRLQPEAQASLPFADRTTGKCATADPPCPEPNATNYLIRFHTSCSKNNLFLGANYSETSGDNFDPDVDPLTDVFLTLVGFCIAPTNDLTNLTCSGEVPQIPDDECPPPGGEGTLPPTDPPSTPPTTSPTKNPTASPTGSPTKNPTESPTKNPTESPTKNPTESPTESPTKNPTESPTKNPTESPTKNPTKSPTGKPTENPTESPTKNPTASPTKNPTESPTKNPTESPTKNPTESPTKNPTESPTKNPTESPTKNPTKSPTGKPTESPTKNPTESPTKNPTGSPTETLVGCDFDPLLMPPWDTCVNQGTEDDPKKQVCCQRSVGEPRPVCANTDRAGTCDNCNPGQASNECCGAAAGVGYCGVVPGEFQPQDNPTKPICCRIDPGSGSVLFCCISADHECPTGKNPTIPDSCVLR